MPELRTAETGMPGSPGAYISSRLQKEGRPLSAGPHRASRRTRPVSAATSRPLSAGPSRPASAGPSRPLSAVSRLSRGSFAGTTRCTTEDWDDDSTCSIDTDFVLWVDPDWRNEAQRTPAGLGYWVDETISQKETVIADVAEYAKEVDDRVLPLFCKELKHRTPLQQRMHLTAFATRTRQLDHVEITQTDCIELLAVLFTLMQRRKGYTNWQTTINRQVSDLAFSVVCQLLGTSHRWFARFLGAMRALMHALRCTAAELNRRSDVPASAGVVPETPETNSDEQSQDSEESEVDDSAVAEARAALEVLLAPPEYGNADNDPFLRTLHAVDQEWLGQMSEGRFQVIEQDIKALDCARAGEDGAEPELTIEELCQPGASIGGIQVASVNAFRRYDRDKSGTMTLSEFLEVSYPDVPKRFLRRRARGQMVCDSVEDGMRRKKEWEEERAQRGLPVSLSAEELLAERQPSATPSAGPGQQPGPGSGLARGKSDVGLRKLTSGILPEGAPARPQPSEVDLEIARLTAAKKFSPEVAHQLYDCFRSLDIDNSGSITWKEIQLNGGMLGSWRITRDLFLQLDKDKSGTISLIELCVKWFPSTPTHELKRGIQQAEDSVRTREQARVRAAQENERQWKANLDRLQAEKEALIAAAKERLRLAEEELEAARQQHRRAHNDRCKERRERRRAREEKKIARRSGGGARSACVPLLLGCDPYPITAVVAGLRLSRESLSLEPFVQDDELRPLALGMLRTLDAAGLCVRFLSKSAPTLLSVCTSDRCRVYRDFSTCPYRPLQPVQWTGFMSVHLKTNIRARSDTMYRFLFEGFNWGANSPVSTIIVGFAGKAWDRIAEMESFGWPAGWDKECIVSLSKGIEKAEQYYTSDGFVAFRLSAHSLMGIGMTVSAWLVTHGHGAGFALAVEWFHRDENL